MTEPKFQLYSNGVYSFFCYIFPYTFHLINYEYLRFVVLRFCIISFRIRSKFIELNFTGIAFVVTLFQNIIEIISVYYWLKIFVYSFVYLFTLKSEWSLGIGVCQSLILLCLSLLFLLWLLLSCVIFPFAK